ncbi:hypothetical protein Y1Q_0009316 [Alligator mississippiensis]|uniref:Uncharacterized protein n=1 Tax=Alligator mississippiensis TaxID=8496 RepID=A0A151N7A3_ALLMI|nr:hypothetical protein Y1Q_0009316 [Alligator mississippiensis]
MLISPGQLHRYDVQEEETCEVLMPPIRAKLKRVPPPRLCHSLFLSRVRPLGGCGLCHLLPRAPGFLPETCNNAGPHTAGSGLKCHCDKRLLAVAVLVQGQGRHPLFSSHQSLQAQSSITSPYGIKLAKGVTS